jgi:hypothetical protein
MVCTAEGESIHYIQGHRIGSEVLSSEAHSLALALSFSLSLSHTHTHSCMHATGGDGGDGGNHVPAGGASLLVSKQARKRKGQAGQPAAHYHRLQ